MVDRFQATEDAVRCNQPVPSWGRRGVLVALATDVPGIEQWRAAYPENRTWEGRDLALVPTVFDRLDRRLCRLLVYRGWWLAGAALAKYHPGLVAAPGAAPPLA
jgi:NTE family protein